MIVDWTAGYVDQGFRQQAEHNRARRLQNRQAIQQYMSDAATQGREVTPDEIAKYAEEISGGSNWLTRAFPAQNFSQSMIEQQNRRAQEQRTMQSAQALQAQALEQKSIGSLVLSEIQSGTADDKIPEKLAEKGLSPEVLARHNVSGLVNNVKQAAVAELIQSPQFKLVQNEEQLNEILKSQPAGLRDITKQLGLDAIRQRQAEEGNVVLQRVRLYEGDGVGLMGLSDSQLLQRADNLVKSATGRADQHHVAATVDFLRTLRDQATQAKQLREAQQSAERGDRRTNLLLKFAGDPTIQSMIANGDRDGAVNFIRTLAPNEISDADVFVDQLRPIVARKNYSTAMQGALKQATDEVRASRGRINTSVSASLQAASTDKTKDVLQAINKIVTAENSDIYVPPGMEDAFGEQVAALAKRSNQPNEILSGALAAVGGARMPVENAIQKRANEIIVQTYPIEPGTRFNDWASRAQDQITRIVEQAKADPKRGATSAAALRRALETAERNPYFFDNPAAAQAGISQLRMMLNQAMASVETSTTTGQSQPGMVTLDPRQPPIPMDQAKRILEHLRNQAAGMPRSSERARVLENIRMLEDRIAAARR